MKRSNQIHRKRRAAILIFFILIVLLQASGSDSLSQELKKLRIEQGKPTTWTFKINKWCARPHFYRVTSQSPFVRFTEQTDKIFVGVREIRKVTAIIDTTGWESPISGAIIVECLNCKEGKKKKG